jgi:hypothetical protein
MRELELIYPERLRQCCSVMPDYMMRELELLHPQRLRQCSSLIPDYVMRVRATTSRASEAVKQPDARLHDERVRATKSRASEAVQVAFCTKMGLLSTNRL